MTVILLPSTPSSLCETGVLWLCYLFVSKGFDLGCLLDMSLSSVDVGRISGTFWPATNEFKLPNNLKDALMSSYQMLNNT